MWLAIINTDCCFDSRGTLNREWYSGIKTEKQAQIQRLAKELPQSPLPYLMIVMFIMSDL